MKRLSLDEAYPGIEFRRGSRGFMARLAGSPPECAHLENDASWMAGLAPETLYLQGKASPRNLGRASRPDVSLCLACLTQVMRPELTSYAGRVVVFEPPTGATQYFFVAREDMAAAGLTPEFASAASARLDELAKEPCEHERSCGKRARWLWLPHDQVRELDETALVRAAPGRKFCAAHGAAHLIAGLGLLEEANFLYMNLPYGDAGAYVWI